MKCARHKRKEWTEYRSSNRQVTKLTTVFHIAHEMQARSIIPDGRIRAASTESGGRLESVDVRGLWVSPNVWKDGSIYGNVRFSFDWESLVDGRNLYWVEAEKKLGPTILRFLLSKEKFESVEELQRYDARKESGPLKMDGDSWYWNDAYNIEFIVLDDLPLSECTKMDFVDHHPDKCKEYGHHCKYLGALEHQTRMSMYAFLISTSTHAVDALIEPKDKITDIDFFVSDLRNEISNRDPEKAKFDLKSLRETAMHAILALCSNGRVDEAKQMGRRFFRDRRAFEKTIYSLISEHFGLESYELPKKLRSRGG